MRKEFFSANNSINYEFGNNGKGILIRLLLRKKVFAKAIIHFLQNQEY